MNNKENGKICAPEMSLAAYVRWTQRVERQAYKSRTYEPEFTQKQKTKTKETASATAATENGGLWQ